MTEILLLITALTIKHFLFDYPLQNMSEITNKGTYGNIKGAMHSIKHAVGTSLVFLLFGMPIFALIAGIIDLITHYHIDWLKVYLTKKVEYNSKPYWNLFGLDQLAHSMIYIIIIFLALGLK